MYKEIRILLQQQPQGTIIMFSISSRILAAQLNQIVYVLNRVPG
jgi:hypothetical protein